MARDPDDEWCDEQLARGGFDRYNKKWLAIYERSVIGAADSLEQLFALDQVRDRTTFSSTESEEEKLKKSPLLVYVFGEVVQ